MGKRGSVFITFEELEAAFRTVIFMKKNKCGKIKATYQKFQRSLKPKVEIVPVRIGLFKQSPGFTNKHLITMVNSQ
jgi:hypothetical protein